LRLPGKRIIFSKHAFQRSAEWQFPRAKIRGALKTVLFARTGSRRKTNAFINFGTNILRRCSRTHRRFSTAFFLRKKAWGKNAFGTVMNGCNPAKIKMLFL